MMAVSIESSKVHGSSESHDKDIYSSNPEPLARDDFERGYDNDNPMRKLNKLWKTPMFQVLLISAICFCNPGMYNAIVGLGGSGQLDSTVSANATVALLAATAATAVFLVPALFAVMGPRACLLVGGWTYALYSASLLNYNHRQNAAFVIVSGALLGVGASFLWISQGSIMINYPHADDRGKAIGYFWVIFNLGGSIGSFATFGLNYHSTSGNASDSTYIAFMVIMLFGWLLSMTIAPPSSVIRRDGTRVASLAGPRNEASAWDRAIAVAKRECINFVTVLGDWRILGLIPMFFCANFFYSYQQNAVNGTTFTIRTRALNGAFYWLAQCFGGIFMGYLLDLRRLTRPQRAIVGGIFLFVTSMAIWGGGLAFQRWLDAIDKKQWLDFTAARIYVGPCFLYIFYGMMDAFWQSYCYWMMGALSEESNASAKYVGLYKAFQAGGAAVSWRLNALKYPALTQFAIDWSLLGASMVIAIPTILSIKPSPISPTQENNNKESRTTDEN